MKKLILYSLLACATVSMQSCLFSEEDLFEQSSADRENASVLELKSLLTSAPNGWKLEYRYGSEGMGGAANLFFKFDANEVTIASDYATSSYTPGQTATSLYTVQSYNGTEISFDSYNEILHAFCEPNGYNDPGLMGDYEFIVRSTSENEIRLTGKKHGVEMVMTRLDDTLDWTTYLAAAAQISEDSDYNLFNLMQGDQKVASVMREGRAFLLESVDENGTSSYAYYPFVCTENGVKTVEPMVCNGISMQNFTWDNATSTFSCTDEGSNVKLVFERPANYEKYLGTYHVQSGSSSFSLTLEVKKDGKSYQATKTYYLSGGSTWTMNVEFYYDTERDDISANGQVVGYMDGAAVGLYPGLRSGGNFYSTLETVFEGTTTEQDGQMTITFKNNPYSQLEMNDWLFIYNSGGYRMMTAWENPVFTKVSD